MQRASLWRRWPGLVADRQRLRRANPFEFTPYSRVFNSGPNGNVQCGTALRSTTTTPSMRMATWSRWFMARRPASGGVESGGDGAYIKYGTFRSELEMKDVFARFSLDLGESANWYVQGSWAQAENASDWIQWVVSPNAGRPNTLFANNPYLTAGHAGAAGLGHRLRNSRRDRLALPAGRAADLAANRQHAAAAAEHRPSSPLPSLLATRSTGSRRWQRRPNRLYRTLGDQKPWNAETGITGELGGFTWEAFYNHGVSELHGHQPQQHRQCQVPGRAGCGQRRRHDQVLGHHPAAVRRLSIPAACRSNIIDSRRPFGGGL